MDSFIRPKNLTHEMSDEELFWRASMVPKKAEFPFRRVPKVAFMFLTRGPLPLLPIWERFFKGHEKLFSIYVHALPGYVLNVSSSSPFFERQIPSRRVEWGSVSLVDAEKRLLANALLDFSNDRFVLLSESCIPVYNFPIVYEYLIGSSYSYVQSYDDPSRYGRGRYSRWMYPDIKLSDWRKGSQWFEMNRTVAILTLSDTKYYKLFKRYCTPACYPDEHYIPTFLHMLYGPLNSNRTVTWVDWSLGGPHPAKFGRENITVDLIQDIRNNGSLCAYNSGKIPVCFLFARKFAPSALEPLLSLTYPVFLEFMNGSAPQTLLTDQNMCLKDAIAIEFPTTKHALCIWMIVAKFPSWFNAILGNRYNEWETEFNRLYKLEEIEDFELGWRDMVTCFGLHTNRRITNLFALRSLWALPFLRGHFFAGLTSIGQSKSINAFIQRFLGTQTPLAYFVEQAAVAVDFKDQAGEQQIVQQNLQNISLRTGAPMESHAASILTPFAFSKLQDQLVSAAHYASFQADDYFLVQHRTKFEGGRKVFWDPQEGIIKCSCNHYEFSGILCKHALQVLSIGNCFEIPERYLPVRWRRISTFSTNSFPSTPKHYGERVLLFQNMVSSLMTESVKSTERLDIAMEHVSVLLSVIKKQPVLSQGMRDTSSIHPHI